MSLIKWDGSLSVDIQTIDDHHKRLIDIINQLYDAMTDGKGNEILSKIIVELIEYTRYHFSYEEKYFKEFNYSRTDSHIGEHQTFISKITEFKAGIENGAIGLSIDITEFLENWLIDHIKINDTKYVSLFHENGLK